MLERSSTPIYNYSSSIQLTPQQSNMENTTSPEATREDAPVNTESSQQKPPPSNDAETQRLEKEAKEPRKHSKAYVKTLITKARAGLEKLHGDVKNFMEGSDEALASRNLVKYEFERDCFILAETEFNEMFEALRDLMDKAYVRRPAKGIS